MHPVFVQPLKLLRWGQIGWFYYFVRNDIHKRQMLDIAGFGIQQTAHNIATRFIPIFTFVMFMKCLSRHDGFCSNDNTFLCVVGSYHIL